MSDNWMRLIATDPRWVPEPEAAERAAAVLRELAPLADEISHHLFDAITFVDCGGNFERIECPGCTQHLPAEWWQEQMDRAYPSGFIDLSVLTPCCATETSLNDLTYHRPMGFARWELVAWGPGRGRLDDRELEALEAAVGHSVREIWTHI